MLCRLLAAAGALLALLAAGHATAQEEGSGAVPGGSSGAVVRPGETPAEAKPAITDPELVEFVNAEYPKEALAEGIQGTVVLKLTIDREGRVTAAEVMTPAGHGFDEAARAAALQFRYKPATRDGKPFAVKIPYAYKFTIKEVEAPAPPPLTTGNLGGELRIAGTDAPLVGAEVVVTLPDGSVRRVTTDSAGRWRIAEAPPGSASIQVAPEGFDPVNSKEEVVAGEETNVTLRLSPKSDGLEVIVRGERPAREVTRRTVDRREIERIPGTGGDALRSIQNLPGVARPPGLSGLLVVRGSGPQDTATFIDGVDVPLIYHFLGLTSVVPTELLEQIDFYPGNFSARYGRVGGGIVDVKLRSPDTRCYKSGKLDPSRNDCFHLLLQSDMLDIRALVQGPLPIDGWTFAAGARRSYFDYWLKPVLEETGAGVTSAPVYYDYQLIAERRTATSRLSLRFFGSDDRVEVLISDPAAQDPAFGGNVRYGSSFYRGQILFETELNRKVSLEASLSAGTDTLEFSIGNYFFTVDTHPVLFRYELGFDVMRGAKLNVGLDFQFAPFDVQVRLPEPPRDGEPDPGPFAARPPIETSNAGTGFRPAWYGELELEPVSGWRVVPGLRADYYRDSNHGDLAPRITTRYDLVKGPSPDAPDRRRTTLKGGAGVFYQPPQFQETDEAFGTPNLYSNRAVHYSIGAEQELTKQVELGIEGFYKDLSRQVSREPSGGNRGYVYANEGSGYVIGLESMLKYKPDERFFGWAAYTLSRSIRQDGPNEDEYLFQFDQTHNLIMLGSYRLGRGWEFGARFRLVSGPLTTPGVAPPSLPSLYSADAGAYAQIQGRPYSERLPLFHQLDLRIDKRWQLSWARFSMYLDVQNVYNNASVEGVSYNYDFSSSAYATGVPIIPNFGFRWEI
ncbi:MAG TPA: TonB-dependent receptor [Polyangiaceae bacterium]